MNYVESSTLKALKVFALLLSLVTIPSLSTQRIFSDTVFLSEKKVYIFLKNCDS